MTATGRSGRRITSETVRFRFDKRDYVAQRGDTVVSALLANGVRLLGRSFKYHRPRGLLAAGPEEPNALLTVRTGLRRIPNVCAAQLLARDGIETLSQNRWPTLRFDLASLLNVGGLFGAGFYYKTFLWPSWKFYEKPIRHMAGLGAAPDATDIPGPRLEHLSCDVLVAGGGPAGLAAALAAARLGAEVVVCEREPTLGGELDFEDGRVDEHNAIDWVSTVARELTARGARLLAETTVVGGSDGMLVAYAEPGGLAGPGSCIFKIRPRQFVNAMGAIERPIAFVDNDRPGIMLLGAAERLMARYGVAAAADPVLFGNHDRLYTAAARLVAAGIRVRALIDVRSKAQLDRPAVARARDRLAEHGVECLTGHTVLRAHGRLALRGVTIAPLTTPGRARRFACDGLFVSGGWTPAVHAGLHEGGRLHFDSMNVVFVADAQPDWRTSAGAAAGVFELGAAIANGYQMGSDAARACGARTAAGGDPGLAPGALGDPAPNLHPFWRSPAALHEESRQFVDFQNDVTVADLRQALGEGFIHIEHIKRYTTLGYGTDQGRIGGTVAAGIIAELREVDVAHVGVSRSRPPYHSLTLTAIAGYRGAGQALRPIRYTALHDWHESHGAMLEAAGYWMRPRYYSANGPEPFTAGCVEALRVRTHGGIMDASTLGKIEIVGADAGAFLDRMYLTRASSIRPGRAKYLVLLREDGMVLDDGLVLRLADDRFLATTSTGHADHVLSHFEHYRATEWPGRKVALASVTEAWAVIVVAGPASRAALRSVLGPSWNAPLGRLAHMDFADGHWREGELRVLRASFSGEFAFELYCRPTTATELWQALVNEGLPPYGLEAVDVLRTEKGYLTDSELSGQATPYDLGMEALVALSNPCVGRELLARPAFHASTRPRLVGLRALDRTATIPAGAQLTMPEAPAKSLGYVTSSVYSPTLGEWVALAFVSRAVADDVIIVARDPLRGRLANVRVTSPVHLDPAGLRMKL